METDERIRSLLGQPSPPTPRFEPTLEGVSARLRARRRRRRTTAATLGAFVVAGLVLPLVLLSGLGRTPRRGPVTPPVRPVFASEIRVHGAVDVAATAEAAWVSGFGTVTRIDPSTDRVVVRIHARGVEDFSSIALGPSSLWVTADRGVVYRINTTTNTVVSTIHVGGIVGGVTVGGGSVWVTQERAGPGDVVQIDPRTDRVVGRKITVGPGPKEVRYGFGSLWVENTSPPSVMRIDLRSGRTSTVPVTGSLALGFGSVWAASDDTLSRLDPATGRVMEGVRIPRAAGVAIGGGEVWVLAGPRSSSPRVSVPIKGTTALWEVDPRKERVVGEPTRLDATQPIAIAATTSNVWIADYVGQTVFRFALASAASKSPSPSTPHFVPVTARVNVGGIAGSVAAGDGSVWVETYNRSNGHDAVVQIDPQRNDVVGIVPVDRLGEQIAVGNGSVWVDSGAFPSTSLLRIDPATDRITGSVHDVHGPVLVYRSEVWAIEAGGGRHTSIVRIDPETLKIELSIPVRQDPFGMVAGAGSIWVMDLEMRNGNVSGGDLLRIDASSGHVAARIPMTTLGQWMAANDSGLWLEGAAPPTHPNSDGYFVDASTDSVSQPRGVDNFRPFAVAEGKVWFIAGGNNPGLPEAGICGLDVRTGAVDECAELASVVDVELAHDPAAYEPTTHSIWIGEYGHPWINRIDVATRG